MNQSKHRNSFNSFVCTVPPLLDLIVLDGEIVPIQKVFRAEVAFTYLVLERVRFIQDYWYLGKCYTNMHELQTLLSFSFLQHICPAPPGARLVWSFFLWKSEYPSSPTISFHKWQICDEAKPLGSGGIKTKCIQFISVESGKPEL